MSTLALDVGGANLKVAHSQGFVAARTFPLWRQREGLADALLQLIRRAPPFRQVAVTMTGELADCYATKAEGVADILAAAERATVSSEMFVYTTHGDLVTCERALSDPSSAAASNWVALANYLRRHVTAPLAMLIDVGSTTTDIVTLSPDRILAEGRTDADRLCRGELVYTGVLRSPVCGLVRTLPWQNRSCPVAQEVFATTADVYVTLAELPEDPSATYTADGRGLTRALARDRLARSICCDRTNYSHNDAQNGALSINKAQRELVEAAVRQVVARCPEQPAHVFVSGSGEFLAHQVLRESLPNVSVLSLAEVMGRETSACAPAFALAVLAEEHVDRREQIARPADDAAGSG